MHFDELDEREILILELMSNSEEPLGSWNLLNRLSEENIETSSATIGRILNKLENNGYLKKEKFKGRIITEKGRHAIVLNKQLKDMAFEQSKLSQYIDPKQLGDFLIVLDARRAIERETAKKAAIYSSPEDINQMEKILSLQEEKYKDHQWITDDDLAFHKLIAKASRNPILESMYSLLAIFGQQSRAFEYLRQKINAEYMVSHRRILNAIKKHDALEAETAMLAHIDNLVEDVQKYWKSCYIDNFEK
ncbi:MAG: FCD domain-containing protein [Peptococcaceae bacterium]